jgi:flagellar motor switch protein FliG
MDYVSISLNLVSIPIPKNGSTTITSLVAANFRQKFLKNMSSRAAEMLVEDMEAKGPVKLSDVEAAQKEILTIARRLEESGELILGGGGEEMV